MCEVIFLPILPVRLSFALPRIGETVGAGLDDARDALAETIADVSEPRFAALIFDAVVQEGSYREVLVPAIFKNGRGNGKKMRDIGCRCALAYLTAVDVCCLEECAIESVGEHGCFAHFF